MENGNWDEAWSEEPAEQVDTTAVELAEQRHLGADTGENQSVSGSLVVPIIRRRSFAGWLLGSIAVVSAVAAALVLCWGWIFPDRPAWVVDDTPMPEPTATFDNVPAQPVQQAEPPAGGYKANRIVVPSLEINAPVTVMGRTGPNKVGTPTDPKVVALFNETSACDAAVGSSLLNGHVSSYGEKGSLYPLVNIKPNAEIVWGCDDGTVTHWRVTGLKTWQKYDDSDTRYDATIYDTKGKRRIVLVTCAGPVITSGPHRGHYRDVVAVYAEPLVEQPTVIPTPTSTPASTPGSAEAKTTKDAAVKSAAKKG